jgi:hypothetical protein
MVLTVATKPTSTSPATALGRRSSHTRSILPRRSPAIPTRAPTARSHAPRSGHGISPSWKAINGFPVFSTRKLRATFILLCTAVSWLRCADGTSRIRRAIPRTEHARARWATSLTVAGNGEGSAGPLRERYFILPTVRRVPPGRHESLRIAAQSVGRLETKSDVYDEAGGNSRVPRRVPSAKRPPDP